MRKLFLSALLMTFTAASHASAKIAVEPVTPNASPEARALIGTIYRLSGRNILSGQQNYAGAKSKSTDRVYEITGKWPALWGSDLGFARQGADGGQARDATVAEAKRQYAAGSIVTLTWRPVRPLDSEPAGGTKLTDPQWAELITPGTPLNQRWEAQVDVVAGYLKQLRDAGIPVLWRPCDDASGNSFWWSGRPGEKGFVALYRLLFERLAIHHQLGNLIWVWDAGVPGRYEDFYPGPAYCDILEAGVRFPDYQRSYHDGLAKLAAGKPIALGEVGALPSPAILKDQPLWTWFLTSADSPALANEPAGLRALFDDPRAVHRGGAAIGAAAVPTPEPVPCEPVNPHATAEARALLKTLCAVSGKFILSAHHNFPNHLAKWSDATAIVVGKYPYIWGSDFGFTGGDDKDSILGRDAMIEEAKRQYAAGSIITLMWHVVRPVDDEPVQPVIGWRESVQAKLTDFEWKELLTPGTNLHRRWLAQIEVAAGYLKRLQDAKIPVLWRPYHENNGNWFWWAGRKGENGFAALYRMTYDRMVNYHHLDNLLWVWNTNAPNGGHVGSYADFFPGLQYCDILATDIYGEYKQSYYDDLVALAKGKPVAIGECSRVPAPAVLKDQPKWAWFMIWADLFAQNKPEAARELFDDPHTLSRGDPLPDK